MSYPDRHCPFLNRSDARCAERFQVVHLQHAFRYCFQTYKACPTYLELLVERRVRRVENDVEAHLHLTPLTIAGKAHAR